MKHFIKKIVTIMLIAATLSTPLVSIAAYSVPVVFESHDQWGSSVSQYPGHMYIYTPLYAPEAVSAKAAGNAIVINASVTKAPPKVQIQYSTDKNFKKNVKTVTRVNKNYTRKPHCAGIYYFAKRDLGEKYWKYGQFQGIRKKGQYTEIEYKAGSREKALAAVKSSSFITKARKKIEAKDVYKITGIKNPQKYYIRIRNIYNEDCLGYDKVRYSGWRNVKVK